MGNMIKFILKEGLALSILYHSPPIAFMFVIKAGNYGLVAWVMFYVV